MPLCFSVPFGLFILSPAIFYKGVGVLATSPILCNNARPLWRVGQYVCYRLSLVSLAEATTLLFTVPIFATLLSILFFREFVGIRRWIRFFRLCRNHCGDALGYCATAGHLMLLYAAFAWSVCVLIAKKLTKSDNVLSITFWQAVGSAPIGFILCLYVWQWPDMRQLLFLFGIAGLGTFGHLLMYAALQRGSVSFILPLDYLRIIWSTTIGIIIFADIPGLNLYIGGALIVGATSFITLREFSAKQPQICHRLTLYWLRQKSLPVGGQAEIGIDKPLTLYFAPTRCSVGKTRRIGTTV